MGAAFASIALVGLDRKTSHAKSSKKTTKLSR
jgi:hypothetical protein